MWESLDQGLYEKIINDSEFKKIDRAKHSGQCNSSIQCYWDYINESKYSAQSVSRAVPESYCDSNNDKTDSSLLALEQQAAYQSGCAEDFAALYKLISEDKEKSVDIKIEKLIIYRGDHVEGNKNQNISLACIIVNRYKEEYAKLNEQFNRLQDASEKNIAKWWRRAMGTGTKMLQGINEVDSTLEKNAIEKLNDCIPQKLFDNLSDRSRQFLIEAKMLQLIPDSEIDFSRDIKGRISLVVEDELVNFLCRKFGEYCQNNDSQTLQCIHDKNFEKWPLATAAFHTLHPEVDKDIRIKKTASKQVHYMKRYLSTLSGESYDERLEEIRKVLFEKITGCQFYDIEQSHDSEIGASNLRNAVMHPNPKEEYQLDDYWKMLTDKDGIMQYCFISPLSPLGSAAN